MKPALLCLSFLGLLGASHADLATTPISRMQTGWWKQRFAEKQLELRTKSPALIWLGDSITQDWERDGPEPWLQFKPIWDRFYGSRNAVDLGFKGDSTCHLLWRMLHGELDGYHPKLAIILIGANNFGHIHTDAAATFRGIAEVIAVLRQKQPQTRIVLIGVLPSIRSSWVDDNTARLNAQLGSGYAHDPLVSYVNAEALFKADGRVDPNDYIDPKLHPPEPALHPTAQAQARLALLIESDVRRDLTTTKR